MRQWRLIYDPPAAGAYNMGIDDALLTLGDVPTLRFYAWNPTCLSIGYGQRAADVDFERTAAQQWDVVRRPTGGRAVLHTNELTYSLSLPVDHPVAVGSIVESYRRISEALVVGLTQFGVDTQADHRAERSEIGAVCFEIPSHYEITVNGRKLVGSAQVRRGARLLQHGSLPLSGDLARICDGLTYPDEAQREAAKAHVHARAITLGEVLNNQAVMWQSVADALVDGFMEVFDIDFHTGQLTPAERDHAERITSEIYAHPRWTRRR